MSDTAPSYDVIVVGVGTMGAATCYELARRGVRVLGLEQFDVPNGMGSAHGYSRVTRLAYFEHPNYVPLLRRSFAMWPEFERELGRQVLHLTGCLSMGPATGEVMSGVDASVKGHDIPHDRLSHADLRRLYPQFVLPEGYVGLLDHTAGVLLPERVVAGFAELALRRGAEIHGQEAVLGWEPDGAGVQVTTRKATYRAAKVVFCGGAWSAKLLGDIGVPLVPTRQVLCWVWPKKPERFALGRLPVWMIDHPDGTNHYGFPMMPDNPGFKLAYHKRTDPVDPDLLNRGVTPADEQTVRPLLQSHIPDADGPLLSCRVCMYTNTPDHHFVIDRHPVHANAFVAAGFSGHGFKFANVIGQTMAELATVGKASLAVEFLGLKRFKGKN